MNAIPQSVEELVDVLAEMTGAVAVVLGGSRAVRSEDEGSDWDLGVYYRGEIDLTALILRDLNVVEYWTRRAEEGEFDRDALLGYIAGVPTYLLTAELASCRVLRGELPTAPPFPPKLAASAPPIWRFCRSFSFEYARAHAKRGNVAGVANGSSNGSIVWPT